MKKYLLSILVILVIISSCKLKDEETDGTNPTDPTKPTTANIKVVSPNGGETLAEGSSFEIKWTGTGSTVVRLLYSIDNGTSWALIADSVKNTGIYVWFPIPNTISNQCQIRISSHDGITSDVSDNIFAIVRNSNESLRLVSPVGNEEWEAGSSKQIKWYSSGISAVKLDYTTNNGNTWNFIATDDKNTGIYFWEPIPNTPSTLAKIRIMDAKDGSPSTESPNPFFILPEPTLKVVSPNGGEKILSGTSRKLEWISENIENVKIAYTTNGGFNWITIIESTPSTGYYVWEPVPNVNSELCKVRVYDVKDGEPNDISDNPFTITNQITQTLEITAPNGGERWQAGTNQSITWTSSGVPKVKIDFTTNNGLTWNNIVQDLSNTGAYEWNVPNSLSTQCLVKISDALDGEPIDQSNSAFRIVPKPELEIISPNGGEVWIAGIVDTIKWKSVGVENVFLEYTINNGISWSTIVDRTPSSGFYITSFTGPSTQYKIRIRDKDNGSPMDESDGTFTVLPEPQIHVLEPNGNEEWYAGSANNIKWTSVNIENVKIEYTTNNGATWSLITASTPSDGVYAWDKIPDVSSLQCRVRISDTKDGIPSDISDENFTITTLGNQLVKVTSPNGGEKWIAGSAQNITWEASGIQNVKIEYTLNNGISWNTITASTPSDGFYTWNQLPSTSSTNCKIRISDAADSAPSDDSDGFFSIEPEPEIQVLVPNGNEFWLSNTSQEIRWTSQNVPDVKIEYTTNGGANWTTIVSSTPSIGYYKWSNIPSINSLQCKVRISDADDGNPADLSDNNFQISNQINKSLQIISPNGSEVWEAGTKQNITWNSSGVKKVKIEFTPDKGANWIVLVNDYEGGAYEWNINPQTNSTQCQIRISDTEDNEISDISDGTFTVEPIKYISVTAPRGPIIFKDSDPVEIKWESTGIKTVGIKFTTTNGQGRYPEIPEFYTLVSKVANLGTFTTSFSLPSDQYYVVVYNADEGADEAPSARSIGNFTVVKTEPSNIIVVQPNGKEQWLKSSSSQTNPANYNPFEIKWKASGLERVKIEYSTNGGGSWAGVPGASSIINNGFFVWAPGSNGERIDSSDNCLIKVSNLSGSLSDISDNFFSIHTGKKIRVEFPNNGEDFYGQPGRSPMAIVWTSYAISGNVNIYYSLQNGADGTWVQLANNYPSTGVYAWDYLRDPAIVDQVTGSVIKYSSLGRIKIVDSADSKVWDVNDIPFWLNIQKTSDSKIESYKKSQIETKK
jgi:DUF971 family protein/lipoprotein signal peptidase